jgi:hypothetical protein
MKLTMLALTIALLSSAAFAQEPKAKPANFATLDTNFVTAVKAYKTAYAAAEKALTNRKQAKADPDQTLLIQRRIDAEEKASSDMVTAFITVMKAHEAVQLRSIFEPHDDLTDEQLIRAQKINNEYEAADKEQGDQLHRWYDYRRELQFGKK